MYDFLAMSRDDRLGVVLYPVEGEAFVIEGHDIAVFVECAYFQEGR